MSPWQGSGQSPDALQRLRPNYRFRSSSTSVRLSRHSLRDLQHWRELCRGEGRELVPQEPYFKLQTESSDLGYGAAFGEDMAAGASAMWEARGIWNVGDRLTLISLRELRAARPNLLGHLQTSSPTRTESAYCSIKTTWQWYMQSKRWSARLRR